MICAHPGDAQEVRCGIPRGTPGCVATPDLRLFQIKFLLLLSGTFGSTGRRVFKRGDLPALQIFNILEDSEVQNFANLQPWQPRCRTGPPRPPGGNRLDADNGSACARTSRRPLGKVGAPMQRLFTKIMSTC